MQSEASFRVKDRWSFKRATDLFVAYHRPLLSCTTVWDALKTLEKPSNMLVAQYSNQLIELLELLKWLSSDSIFF